MQASALRANSMHFERQWFRFLGLGFGYVNAQHTVLRFGLNALGVDVIRQHKATREGAVDAFDPNCVLALVLPFQFTFAADGDDTVRHGDLHVLLLYVRKLNLDEIFILGFADVGERYPVSRRGFIPSCPVIRHVKRRKSTQRILHFTKWFPTQHGHAESSYNETTTDNAVTPRGLTAGVRCYGVREAPP